MPEANFLSLPEGSALVIARPTAIHTFFMRFAIDVAGVQPCDVLGINAV